MESTSEATFFFDWKSICGLKNPNNLFQGSGTCVSSAVQLAAQHRWETVVDEFILLTNIYSAPTDLISDPNTCLLFCSS